MHPDNTFWPWHMFGIFPMFFFLFAIIIAFLIGRKIGSDSAGNNAPTYRNSNEDQGPIEILKIRYAKGEIGQEEFEKMKKTISE